MTATVSVFHDADCTLEARAAIRNACLNDKDRKLHIDNFTLVDAEILTQEEKGKLTEFVKQHQGKSLDSVMLLLTEFVRGGKPPVLVNSKVAPTAIVRKKVVAKQKVQRVQVKVEREKKKRQTIVKKMTDRFNKHFKEPFINMVGDAVELNGKFIHLFGQEILKWYAEPLKRKEVWDVSLRWVIDGRKGGDVEKVLFPFAAKPGSEAFKKLILGTARQLVLCYLSAEDRHPHPADPQGDLTKR